MIYLENNQHFLRSITPPRTHQNLFFCLPLRLLVEDKSGGSAGRRAQILEKLRIVRQNDGCTFTKRFLISRQSAHK